MSNSLSVSMRGVSVCFLVAAAVFVSVSLRAAEVGRAQEEEQSKEEAEKRKPFYWDDGLFFGSPAERLKVQFGAALQNDSAAFVREADVETVLGSL